MAQVLLFLADNTQIPSLDFEKELNETPVLLPRGIFYEDRMSLELKPEHTDALEQILSKAYRDFKSLKLRYPLYLLVDEKDLELIARLTRLGALPFMGECSLYTQEENEKKWEEITDLLRKRFPQKKK